MLEADSAECSPWVEGRFCRMATRSGVGSLGVVDRLVDQSLVVNNPQDIAQVPATPPHPLRSVNGADAFLAIALF